MTVSSLLFEGDETAKIIGRKQLTTWHRAVNRIRMMAKERRMAEHQPRRIGRHQSKRRQP